MTNEEILVKAMEKAVKNGWHQFDDMPDSIDSIKVGYDHVQVNCSWANGDKDHFGFNTTDGYENIIFSHDFAKAFFGETELIDPPTHTWAYKNWEWELQQMVLEEEPLKYLERFLD